MVEDIGLSVSFLDRILQEARNEGLSFGEKAGLYAALEEIVRDIDKFLASEKSGDHYAKEKLHKFAWSVRAILGFDIDNGHPASQHAVWALSAMGTLKNVLGLDRD